MTTDADRLAAIKTRAEGATPPPWRADVEVRGDVVVWGPDGQFLSNAQAEPHWLPAADGSERAVQFDVDRRDAEFIAHARIDVPWLLAEVERLSAAVEAVRALHKSDGHAPDDCGDPDCWEGCAECTEPWPCPTRRALDGTGAAT